MPGEIKRLVDSIITKRAKGNPTIEITTKTKLLLKGINADSYTSSSPDDAVIIHKIKQIASEMGVGI